MQDIFYSMHVIDLDEDTAIEYNAKDKVKAIVNHTHGAAEMMIQVMNAVTSDDYQQEALSIKYLNGWRHLVRVVRFIQTICRNILQLQIWNI